MTIMLLDEGWDTGPLFCRRAVAIGPEENAGSLHDRLAVVGAELLVETMAGLAMGTLSPQAQDEALATRAPKMRPEEMHIDWHEPAARLHNLVRPLPRSPGRNFPGRDTFTDREDPCDRGACGGYPWYSPRGA